MASSDFTASLNPRFASDKDASEVHTPKVYSIADGVMDGVTKTGSVSSATTVISFSPAELQGMGYIAFGFTAVGTGNTIVVEGALDGTNFNAIANFWRVDSNSGTPLQLQASPTTAYLFVAPVVAQAMRIRISVYGSGTVTAYAIAKRGPVPPTNLVVTGTLTGTGNNVNGNAASAATDSGNPVKIGGVYNTTLPTFTNAQRGDVQLSARGSVNVHNLPDANNNQLTTHRLLAAATTNATSVKTTAGRIMTGYVYNTTASAKFLKLYNKTSAPTVGTDTPVMTLPIAANGSLAIADLFGVYGQYFSSGIAYALTGAVADADTTALAANDIIVNLGYI